MIESYKKYMFGKDIVLFVRGRTWGKRGKGGERKERGVRERRKERQSERRGTNKQVHLNEISRSPAHLCPPTKALPMDQRTDGATDGPMDQQTDTPSYRVVAHD